MKKNLPKINPCPYCGCKTSTVYTGSFGRFVWCPNTKCCARGPMRKTYLGAINAYNKAKRLTRPIRRLKPQYNTSL